MVNGKKAIHGVKECVKRDEMLDRIVRLRRTQRVDSRAIHPDGTVVAQHTRSQLCSNQRTHDERT